MAEISTENQIVTTRIDCSDCNCTGRQPIPDNYEEVWGRTLINGEMVCENCNGKGYLNRSFIPLSMLQKK